MYHLVVTRLLMALIEETGPGVPIPEGGQTATKVAGAEGFEPSALGFGDRCSDQTELRPWASRKVYPAALRQSPGDGLGLAEGLFAEGQVVYPPCGWPRTVASGVAAAVGG